MSTIPSSPPENKRNPLQPDQNTKQFFRMLFRNLPGRELKPGVQLYLSIWSTPLKIASFHTTVESAAAKVAELTEQGENVYFGCSLTAGKPDKGRGKLNDMGAIYFVWADVDFYDGTEAHKPKQGGKKMLPGIKAAKEVLKKVGLLPSIITHSGHGLQAFWLLSEPILMKDDAERKQAAQLSKSWVDTVRSCARAQGCDLDAVHDLTRVLRAVGSVNVKVKDKPMPVKLVHPARGKPKVYERGSVEAFVVPGQYSPNSFDNPSKVVVDVDVVTPKKLTKEQRGELQASIDGMCMNDPQFKRIWRRERTDQGDHSASGYDWAIARSMVAAGCDDQSIVDTILLWRMKHKEDTNKVMRRKYMMDTIGRAKLSVRRDVAANNMRAETPTGPTNSGELDAAGRLAAVDRALKEGNVEAARRIASTGDDPRARARADILRILGINVVEVVQRGEEDARFEIVIAAADNTRPLVIGRSLDLLTSRALRGQLLERGIVLPPIKTDPWMLVLRAMQTLRQVVPTETPEEETLRWLARLATTAVPVKRIGEPHAEDVDTVGNGLLNGRIVLKDHEGRIGFPLTKLLREARVVQRERIASGDMTARLSRLGFEKKRVNAYVGDKRHQPSVWISPPAFLDRLGVPE